MHDPIASLIHKRRLDQEAANAAAANARPGRRAARPTAPGSARALRLIPVIARGVAGAIPGRRR